MTESSTNETEKKVEDTTLPDENMHLFVYGSIVIKDVETGSVLVKKSF